MLFSKRNENRAWSQVRVKSTHCCCQPRPQGVKGPWGRGCGLLHISYKVWETRLTQQISYPFFTKLNLLSLKKTQKPYHPWSNKYSLWMRACGSILFLPSKILVFKCSVNVLFYYHHKLYISLNSYKGLTTLKESLRAAKRPLENVIKTFPSNSVRVWAEKRINKL